MKIRPSTEEVNLRDIRWLTNNHSTLSAFRLTTTVPKLHSPVRKVTHLQPRSVPYSAGCKSDPHLPASRPQHMPPPHPVSLSHTSLHIIHHTKLTHCLPLEPQTRTTQLFPPTSIAHTKQIMKAGVRMATVKVQCTPPANGEKINNY